MEAHSRSAGGHEATPDSYKYFKHPDLVPAFQAPVPQGQEAPDELHPEKSVKRAAAAAANVVTMVNQLATTRSRPQSWRFKRWPSVQAFCPFLPFWHHATARIPF
jgi:hypothetical protein